jgi:hypothetical protein
MTMRIATGCALMFIGFGLLWLTGCQQHGMYPATSMGKCAPVTMSNGVTQVVCV